MIIDGDTMYMRSPLFAMLGSDFDDDTWGKVSLGEDIGSLGSLMNTGDYRSFLANLHGAKEVEDLGRQKVDGQQTTHYRVQVDMAQALEQAHDRFPENLREALREQMKAQAALLADEPMTMDVWVRDDDLIARIEQTFAIMGMEMVSRINFSGYGKPVKITLPDPDKVKELGDLEELSGDGMLALDE